MCEDYHSSLPIAKQFTYDSVYNVVVCETLCNERWNIVSPMHMCECVCCDKLGPRGVVLARNSVAFRRLTIRT